MTTEKLSQKGLRYEITEIEKIIAGKKKRGEDTKFEEELVRSYPKYLRTQQKQP